MHKTAEAARPATFRRSHPKAWILAASIAALLLWVPLFTGLDFPSRGDEVGFHVPNVLRFADHFPSLDEMRGTDLSMLPLFHGVLGALSRISGRSLPALRSWMMLIGLGSLVLYFLVARRVPGVDGGIAALVFAAFPYFGVCYFVVLTDIPALAALFGAVLAQIAYLRTGRLSVVWLAGIAGAAACLVRQNAIFASAVFPVVLWIADRGLGRIRNPRDPEVPVRTGSPAPPRLLRPAVLPALALPFLGVAFQIWLWKGLIPPSFMNRASYYEPGLGNMLLSITSIAANVGYYFLPVSLAFLLAEGRSWTRRTWIPIGLGIAFGIFWCIHLRGRDLVNTYGTFLHGLSFLSYHFGIVWGALALGVSLGSFFALVAAGVRACRTARSCEPLLLAGLFLGALLVTGFGLTRIYERHILPVFALGVLLYLSGAPAGDRRLRWGWLGVAAFGAIHGVVYSISLYGARHLTPP